MVVYENNCVGCDRPCIDCGRRHQRAVVCDECDGYADYYTPWGDLCEDCLYNILVEELRDYDYKKLEGLKDWEDCVFNNVEEWRQYIRDDVDLDTLCELAGLEVSEI